MNIEFEHDYQHKVMRQRFAEPTTIASNADLLEWRKLWMKALSSWHSPYKLVLDCSNLTVALAEELKAALDTHFRFFNNLFLKKVAGFGKRDGDGLEQMPFEVFATEAECLNAIGYREAGTRHATDFRSTINLENHFRQHVVELSFLVDVVLDSKEKFETLKSKIMNNLMQWHSKWSLMIDCTHMTLPPENREDFERLLKGLRGFFMKDVVGFGSKQPKDQLPFEAFRVRHRAAAVLEGEGAFGGDAANCRSRQEPSK